MANKKRLYLDDLRTPPAGEGYQVFRTVVELQTWIEANGLNEVEEISLDHDLGQDMPTGYDFINWLERYVIAHNLREMPRIVSHSSNPAGRANIERAVEAIRRWIKGGAV